MSSGHERELGEIHATLLSIREDLAEIKELENRISKVESLISFLKGSMLIVTGIFSVIGLKIWAAIEGVLLK
jgi:hypothetical protein